MRICLAVVSLVVVPSLAHADVNADVTQAVTAFVDGVAKNKAPAVELFITPGYGERDDSFVYEAVPKDISDARGVIASSKVVASQIEVSKSGKSAWLAGEIAGHVERQGKAKAEPIRVSAFLIKDDHGWHVQATHWSTGEPDRPSNMCGNREEWSLHSSVPKEAQAAVKSVYDGLAGEYTVEHGASINPAKFGKLLSDDSKAYVIGSAPKEVIAGGAKIKSVLKKWEITAYAANGAMPARAGVGPDGEMMWLAMGVIAPPGLCTTYRSFFVLAKESAGWRIVHQHYSEATNPY
jgi:hypothetical protein